MVREIEKAIMTSDLGINPTNDGTTVRLLFPELTEDRRKELVKDVKKKGEAAKVAIRNIRRDGIDSVKKLKGSDVSEDEMKDMEDDLQKLTDKYIADVDAAVAEKTKEIMIRPVRDKSSIHQEGDKVQMLWKLSPLFLYTYCY